MLLPGEEFLQRRLARASAIPPEQRSPEVAASVAAEQLPKQIAALLPLWPDGTAACRCQDLLLPEPPGGGGSTGQLALARFLMLYMDACPCLHEDERQLEAVSQLGHALKQLSGPNRCAAMERCLQQLAGLQRGLGLSAAAVPTLAQVRCLCHCLALDAIVGLGIAGLIPGLPPGAWEALQGVAEEAAAEALQLEPDSPKVHLAVGNVLTVPGKHQRAMDHYLRCAELAQQQGSDLFTAAAGIQAVILIGPELSRSATSGGRFPVSRASMQAALEAFRQAEPALKRCKRLLPQGWVAEYEAMLPMARGARQAAQLRLQRWQVEGEQAATDSIGSASQARSLARRAAETERAMLQLAEQALVHEALMQCDGCGQSAVGLQRCARCRRARYCSCACQLAHWPQHRAECRGAQAQA
ncbi:hypothetical protein ABPG75_003156 [Micractinium tetrahymenae]